jgi:drug/metabolite transporter (DMT)-like permease
VRVAAILGGFGAAICWGTSTFCSSRSTRMIGASSVLAWVMLVGLVLVTPFVALRGVSHGASAGDFVWLAVASIGGVGGLGISYVALRRGKVSIVAPICATEGGIAALLAVAFGEHLAVATGISLAVIAVGVTLASVGHAPVDGRSPYPSILLAMVAALLFGASLYASGRIGPAFGAASILLGARALAMLVILLPLLARRQLRLTRAALPLVLVSGVFEVLGFASFIAGVGDGAVAVPAVLSSLFAVVAGVLGFVLVGERLRHVQLAGVATILTGVVALSGLQT